MLGGDACLERAANVPAARLFRGLAAAARQVKHAAALGKGDGLVAKVVIAAAVGGQKGLDGDFGFIKRAVDHLEHVAARTHVHDDQTGLARNQPAHAGVGRHADKLVKGGVRAAVVAERNLDAHALTDERDIAHHAARQGDGWHLIAAGQHECGDSFLL